MRKECHSFAVVGKGRRAYTQYKRTYVLYLLPALRFIMVNYPGGLTDEIICSWLCEGSLCFGPGVLKGAGAGVIVVVTYVPSALFIWK